MTEPRISHPRPGGLSTPVDASADLSVAIVTYNSAEHIAACLTSLVADTSELCVQTTLVDNASTDATLASIEAAVSQLSDRRHWFDVHANSKNIGFTRALNSALKYCAGKYVLVLNPDTEILAPCMDTLFQALRQEDNVGVVAPQLLNKDGSVQPSCRRFPRRRDVLFEISGMSRLFPRSRSCNSWKMGDFDHRSRSLVDQPQGAFLLFERKLLLEAGFWDERFPMFFSDVDWCLRVRHLGYNILFEPAAQVIHHKGASVYSDRSRMIRSSLRSFYHYFRKHCRNILFVNEFLGLILWVTAAIRVGLFHLAGCLRKSGKQ